MHLSSAQDVRDGIWQTTQMIIKDVFLETTKKSTVFKNKRFKAILVREPPISMVHR